MSPVPVELHETRIHRPERVVTPRPVSIRSEREVVLQRYVKRV